MTIPALAEKEVLITYLGQVGYLFEFEGCTIAIDPYLTDSCDRNPAFPHQYWRRLYPPPLRPDQLAQTDAVLVTHDHGDHLDPETLSVVFKAAPQCHFYAPRTAAQLLSTLGISERRIHVLNADVPIDIKGIRVLPVASAHEEIEKDAEGFHRYLGYILQTGALKLYHAGDTVRHAILDSAMAKHKIDIGFLPINGRDPARQRLGIVGNMTGREAIEFAARHHFEVLVPTHFDLYANNGASLPQFVSDMESLSGLQKFKVFRPGERLVHRNTPSS